MNESHWVWLRRERYLYLAVPLLAAAASIWVQFGVIDLRAATERRDQQLTEFQGMHAELLGVSAEQAGRHAGEFHRRLAAQDWYAHLPGARPQLIVTAAGLVVHLNESAPSDKGSEARDR